MAYKQTIIIRKDLNMRRGKEIAQGSHASMTWLARKLKTPTAFPNHTEETETRHGYACDAYLTKGQIEWLKGTMTKVTLQVDSEAELISLYEKADAAGLTVCMITDMGKTEFHGVETNTCLAIGPNDEEAINALTKDLKLY